MSATFATFSLCPFGTWRPGVMYSSQHWQGKIKIKAAASDSFFGKKIRFTTSSASRAKSQQQTRRLCDCTDMCRCRLPNTTVCCPGVYFLTAPNKGEKQKTPSARARLVEPRRWERASACRCLLESPQPVSALSAARASGCEAGLLSNKAAGAHFFILFFDCLFPLGPR